jgi:hypothetical protein
MLIILAFRRLRQDDLDFKASRGYTEGSYLKNKIKGQIRAH